MGVGAVPGAHLLDGGGEQGAAVEDVGIFGEEAEDQPRHEVVHVMAARLGAPFGVVLQQFDIEPVQAAGRPDVEGAFADLLDGGDAGQRQEEAESGREIGIGAGDGFAEVRSSASKVSPSVARMNLALAARWPGWPCRAARVRRTWPAIAGGDVDVVGLKDAAQVGLVRRAGAQALEVVSLLPKASRKAKGNCRFQKTTARKFRSGLH
jgi:hypothetical protein